MRMGVRDTRTHTDTHTNAHTHKHTQRYTHTNTHTRTKRKHSYTHKYTDTHADTHIHTHHLYTIYDILYTMYIITQAPTRSPHSHSHIVGMNDAIQYFSLPLASELSTIKWSQTGAVPRFLWMRWLKMLIPPRLRSMLRRDCGRLAVPVDFTFLCLCICLLAFLCLCLCLSFAMTCSGLLCQATGKSGSSH